MNKEELRGLIDSMDVYMPISKIEEEVGMAKTTLQKALKYPDKKLPKKWIKPLINFCKKSELVAETATLKSESPPPKPFAPINEDYKFGDEEWLSIEKYTKYPSKDKPHGRAEIYQWSLMKADADEKLKAAWEEHKKNKNQQNENI